MMIRSVAVLACLITAAVMGYFIRDINRRFPNPSVCEQYTKDSPAMLDGLEITPLSTHIYSYDEYRERYPDSLDAGEHAKDWKVIVYKLAFRNTTEKELRFEADSFLAVAQNSGFHNGVSQENRKKNQTIQPGEVQEIELSCTVTEILIGEKWFQKLEEETYTLVYWWYPVHSAVCAGSGQHGSIFKPVCAVGSMDRRAAGSIIWGLLRLHFPRYAGVYSESAPAV